MTNTTKITQIGSYQTKLVWTEQPDNERGQPNKKLYRCPLDDESSGLVVEVGDNDWGWFLIGDAADEGGFPLLFEFDFKTAEEAIQSFETELFKANYPNKPEGF